MILFLVFILLASPVYAIEQLAQTSRYEPGEKNAESHRRSVDADLRKLFFAMQGRLAFGESTDGVDGENIEGEFQVVADTGTANTEFAVAHTLNKVPNGYIVVKNNKNGVVYDGTTANSATNLYLRHGAANSSITVFIF